ncbi:hypothetical protein J2X63_000483 [Agromyces sp. 3263]|uniref:DUF4012 domain-containing protein n=1 Tax=Agromyces sp. 3263 TaxID=2817750 RepID=UPI00285FE382|nr:DUF4012 domain-containing protein [Agromyces sp. 3263]MDR6904797.1 hypothetical protein [Agromyces sp. 3263]
MTLARGEPRRGSRRVAHAIVWPILALVLVGVGCAAWWLYSAAMSVRDDLVAARSAVSDLQRAAEDRRWDQLEPIAEELSDDAASAVEPTTKPLWRTAESLPVVGENFRAVRVTAEGVDEVSTEIVDPAVGLVGTFGLRRDPATGGFDLDPLRQATEIVATADRVVGDLRERVRSLDLDATIGQVSQAVEQFDGMLGTAQETIPQLSGALASIGALLGIDGQKDVVLAFLNNAEAAALGGGPAAQTLLSVDDGTITIARQVSSRDFPTAIPVELPVDESATQLYDSILLDNINAATSRPDFPTAAQIISANWQRTFGVTPDDIISLDPIALSRILEVTGPVAMPDGDQLTSDNVVSKLLNEAYFRYPEGVQSDPYFAAAASAVFARIMAADYDVWAMGQALVDAANRGTLMMWSADPATQALFDGTRLQGVLPATNEGATVAGVYFRDRSSSKIDYYLHTEATVTTDACTPDAPTFTIEVRLAFDIPDDVRLPEFVNSNLYGFYRTEVFLYGPVGATTTAVEVLESGLAATTGPSVTDLARPAEKFTVDMEDGQTALVRATFTGAPETYGPTAVRTTPMINPTTVTLNDAPCG